MAIALDKYPKHWSERGKEILLSYEKACEFLDYLYEEYEGYVAFDTETENLNKRYNNKLVSLQFAINDKKGYVLIIDKPYTTFSEKQLKVIRKKLKKLFESDKKNIIWIMHNAQFDLSQVLTQLGVKWVYNTVYDTQLFIHLLDENLIVKKHDYSKLKDKAAEYFNFTLYEKEAIDARGEGNLLALPKDKFVTYAGMDAYVTYRLFMYLKAYAKEIGYWSKACKLLKYVYSPALKSFCKISLNGFYIDKKQLQWLLSSKSPILGRLEEIKQYYYNNPIVKAVNKELSMSDNLGVSSPFGFKTKWVFDMNKPKHRVALFFTSKKGLQLKNDDGSYHSDETFQAKYRDSVELVKIFSEEQELKKQESSYMKPIFNMLSQTGKTDLVDGRIRPTFLLNGTVTGRISSVSPNLQQIPRSDTYEKKQIKCMYAAEPNKKRCLLQADFCANEIRFWGLVSEDHNLCKAFNDSFKKGQEFRDNPTDEKLAEEAHLLGDIHKQTAAMMFDIDVRKVDKGLRQQSKGLSLGIMYQRGTYSVAQQMGVKFEEAQEKVDKFNAKFPEGVQWAEEMKKFVLKHGYVESPIGRRRHLNEDIAKGKALVEKSKEYPRNSAKGKELFKKGNGFIARAQRQSVNSPIQGVANDVAMVSSAMLNEYIATNDLDWLIVNTVHDSVVVELPQDDLMLAAKVIRNLFTKKNKEYFEKHFPNWKWKTHVDIDFEVSQGKAKICKKCGKMYMFGLDKCECGCEDYKVKELNHGYGTLVSFGETKQDLKLVRKGF